MLDYVRVFSPAKINLSLKVLSKRSDKYHDIESIFQLIPFGDELEVFFLENEKKCIVDCRQVELPLENTITKTYEEFSKITGINHGVRVVLHKHIPLGAGLGGGSSNAAAFLRVLNTMFDAQLSYATCKQIAQKIGSDVPFFVAGGTKVSSYDYNLCCIVTGRGENIQRINESRSFNYVLICPEVHIATKEAYALVDENQDLINDSGFPLLHNLEKMYKMSVDDWHFKNSFTDILRVKYPIIGQAIEELKSLGAAYAQMSGSGSSVYGIFNSIEEAKKAGNLLEKKWKRCFILPSS